MASVATGTVQTDLRVTWAEVDAEPHDDEVLLRRFLEGDEHASGEAFGDLVRRHGPMVLGVCRQILDQHHDAEDAFQATFLVLARNAAGIRDRRVVSRWLYEVAYRTAVRARFRSSRRRAQEKEAAEMSSLGYVAASDPAWAELRPVLHEEVNRLPEKYRSAVVLCYLEGRTNEEAAAVLGWPVGTVKGRLSRAREMLRSRLLRRGLALSAVFLLSRLSQNAVFAEVVPGRLVTQTTRAALAVSRGGSGAAVVTPEVLELAEEGAQALAPWGALAPRVVTVSALAALFTLAALVGWLFVAYRSAAAGSGRPAPAPAPASLSRPVAPPSRPVAAVPARTSDHPPVVTAPAEHHCGGLTP